MAIWKEKSVNTLSLRSSFQDVRLIEDVVDKVTSNDTNRPHKDIIANYEKLSDVEDITRGVYLGEWDSSISYSEGEIVTFMSDFYSSKTDNNLGNFPPLATDASESEYWSRVVKISGLRSNPISKFVDGKKISSDGKGFNNAKASSHTRYSLLQITADTIIDEKFKLVAIFDSGKIVRIDLRIRFARLRANSRGLSVPELHIGAIQSGSTVDEWSDFNNEYPADDTEAITYDKFGPYGVTLSVEYSFDRNYRIFAEFSEPATLELTGGDGLKRFMFVQADNYAGQAPYYRVRHLVRPWGGDSAKDIGMLKQFPVMLSKLQQWNNGLLLLNRDIVIPAVDYSLLAYALGYQDNFNPISTDSTEITTNDYNTDTLLYKANPANDFAIRNLTNISIDTYQIQIPAPFTLAPTKYTTYIQAF